MIMIHEKKENGLENMVESGGQRINQNFNRKRNHMGAGPSPIRSRLLCGKEGTPRIPFVTMPIIEKVVVDDKVWAFSSF